jgi:anti-sigma factor RsiW
MNLPDDTTILEMLDLEADGSLPEADRARLEAVLAEDPASRRELDELKAMPQTLAKSRVEVDPGFQSRVMDALPVAAWEPAGRQGWGLAAAIAVALATVSALLFGLSGAGQGAGPVLGIVAAVGQALQASLVTGAGLLGASWRGVGLALGELLTVSPLTTVAFGVAVLALNLLFFRLLRRDVRAPQLAARGTTSTESSSSDR